MDNLRYVNGRDFVDQVLAGRRDFSCIKLEESFCLNDYRFEELNNYFKKSDEKRQLVRDPVTLNQSECLGLVTDGLYLPHLRAENAKFDYSNIMGSNFKGSRLIKASFIEANFSGCEFEGSRMNKIVACGNDEDHRTNFENSRFERVYLQGAELEFANFKNSYLKKTDLEGANCEYADFKGANLLETLFLCTYLHKADFRDVQNLNEAELLYMAVCLEDVIVNYSEKKLIDELLKMSC